MSVDQAMQIFSDVNCFFTKKWPFVVSLIFQQLNSSSESEQKFLTKLESQLVTMYNELIAMSGVKQHSMVRNQLKVHSLLTQILFYGENSVQEKEKVKFEKQRRKLDKNLIKVLQELQFCIDIHNSSIDDRLELESNSSQQPTEESKEEAPKKSS